MCLWARGGEAAKADRRLRQMAIKGKITEEELGILRCINYDVQKEGERKKRSIIDATNEYIIIA